MKYAERISEIIETVSGDLLEKDEVISMTLLCLLAGKSVFLYGPPGTAKSLIARRVSRAFKNHKYFDYLMNRFSSPEEIFGPLKLSELRKDNLVRNTEGYLPEADFAFLDEIWKSNPAILNTLLTIINEKKFRNGTENIDVPLKGLIAASNELPQKGQSLEALYDRFIMRLSVPRLKEKENFQKLLTLSGLTDEVEIDDSLKFGNDELNAIKETAKDVSMESEVTDILILLRDKIAAYNDKLQNENSKEPLIDISERRWVAIMELLRVAALLNDRTSVMLADLVLIKHCLWDEECQKEQIEKMLEEALANFTPTIISCEKEYKKLKHDITQEITHQINIYKIMNIKGLELIPFDITVKEDNVGNTKTITVYADKKHIGDGREHNCYTLKGHWNSNNFNEDNRIKYKFNKQAETCDFLVPEWVERYGYDLENDYYKSNHKDLIEIDTLDIPMEYQKGQSKSISSILKEACLEKCHNLKQNMETEIKKFHNTAEDFKEKNANIFLKETDYNVLLKSFAEAEENINQLITDIEKLSYEVENAEVK